VYTIVYYKGCKNYTSKHDKSYYKHLGFHKLIYHIKALYDSTIVTEGK